MSKLHANQFIPLLLVALSLNCNAADTNQRSAAELLPQSVIASLEIENPVGIVTAILDHPIAKELQLDPEFAPLLRSKEMTAFKAGLGVFQASVGMRWKRLLEEIAVDGVTVAFDAEESGIALLTRASSSEVLTSLRETVFSFVRAGKLAGSEDDPIKESEYEGFQAARINDDFAAAIMDDWLLVTNKPELGKAIIDRYVNKDEELKVLAKKANYVEALNAVSAKASGSDAWAYVDIQTIRESGTADAFYSGKTDNFLAELLLGGIVSNLQHAPFVTFQLDLSSSGLTVALCSPYDKSWIPEERQYFFGPSGRGSAPEQTVVSQQILSLGTYRGLSEMWLRASDLMVESAVDALDQADSQLSLFFSGQDFAEDFLASFEPEMALYASRPDFDALELKPAIKIPAFALELQMKTPKETTRTMRRLFLNFVGFLNIISAMEGQPQLDFDFDENESTRFLVASYLELPEVPVASSTAKSQLDNGPINYNFSPTLALQGSRLIISSTSQLARQLASVSLGEEVLDDSSVSSNTNINVQAKPIVEMLQDNFEQLVSQNMLEKGHTRQEAESEIGLILKIVGYLKEADIELVTSENTLELNAEVKVRLGE